MRKTIQTRQNKVGTYDKEGNSGEEYDDPAGRKRCVRADMDVYITNVSPDVAGEDGFVGGMLGEGSFTTPRGRKLRYRAAEYREAEGHEVDGPFGV